MTDLSLSLFAVFLTCSGLMLQRRHLPITGTFIILLVAANWWKYICCKYLFSNKYFEPLGLFDLTSQASWRLFHEYSLWYLSALLLSIAVICILADPLLSYFTSSPYHLKCSPVILFFRKALSSRFLKKARRLSMPLIGNLYFILAIASTFIVFNAYFHLWGTFSVIRPLPFKLGFLSSVFVYAVMPLLTMLLLQQALRRRSKYVILFLAILVNAAISYTGLSRGYFLVFLLGIAIYLILNNYLCVNRYTQLGLGLVLSFLLLHISTSAINMARCNSVQCLGGQTLVTSLEKTVKFPLARLVGVEGMLRAIPHSSSPEFRPSLFLFRHNGVELRENLLADTSDIYNINMRHGIVTSFLIGPVGILILSGSKLILAVGIFALTMTILFIDVALGGLTASYDYMRCHFIAAIPLYILNWGFKPSFLMIAIITGILLRKSFAFEGRS